MKAPFSITIAVVLAVSGLFDVSWAHIPEGMVYPAFQWPKGYEPTIDGNLQEWEIIPDTYILRTDPGRPMSGIFGDFFDLLHEMDAPALDTTDFHIPWSAVGWSDYQNLLYVAVRAVDDMHYIERIPSWGDHFGVALDADHSGGQYQFFSGDLTPEEKRDLRHAQATSYYVFMPPSDERSVYTSNAGTWMLNPPYTDARWKISPSSGGGSVVTYEFAVTPFDWLSWRGAAESRVHDLAEGEVIGFTFFLHDLDEGEVRGRFFSLSALGRDARFADFLLAPADPGLFSPSGIISLGWGRLKRFYMKEGK